MWQKIKPFIVSIAIPLGVGLLSTAFTLGNMQLYSEVKTPPLSPPGFLFPIVWTILYVLMGVSSGIIYNNRELNSDEAGKGLRFYAISLIFNFGWSIIFFNMRAFFFSLIWLIALLYFIIRTIISYRKVAPLAAYLQIPYALWVAFAGYLNAGIWLLN